SRYAQFSLAVVNQVYNKFTMCKEGTIQHLFEGHDMNYIECINMDYKSTRKESFYDIQLVVKGCRDVYASFDKYVEVKRLEGDNRYHAEQHGLQINDRYEFPLQLDLDREDGKYLSPQADKSVQNLYTLHNIMVHSGGVHGGYYYAYIRPTLFDKWFKFDDERVTKEVIKRALDEPYEGEGEKCHADEPLAIPLDELYFDDKLHFVEEPVEIVDREVKQLKRSRIPLVKVAFDDLHDIVSAYYLTSTRIRSIGINTRSGDYLSLTGRISYQGLGFRGLGHSHGRSDSTGTPFSTTVDQDKPSPGKSHTTTETQSSVIPQNVKEDNLDIKVVHIGNDPLFDVPILEVTSAQSTSMVSPHSVVQPDHQIPQHTSKWIKDHPLNNIINQLSRPVSTRLQLHEQALLCYYNDFLTSVEPKTYKEALTQSCWIEAMQEELNEFERLEVWELVPRLDKVMICLRKTRTQIYGKLLPESLTSPEMKETKAFMTYLGFVTRPTPPKIARKFKNTSPSKKDLNLNLVPVEEEPKSDTPMETSFKRNEKVDVTRGKGIELPSKVALTEHAQFEKVQRKSLRDFYKTHPSGSYTVTKTTPSGTKIKPFVTNKGIGVKPGVPDVTKEVSTECEPESWGKDEDDSNKEQDSRNSEHETDKNELGSESDQEEYKEEIGDDEEGDEGEFVKTPSNDSDDEDETKITDKAEGDEDEEMDDPTNQLYDDLEEPEFKVANSNMPQDQEENLGNDNEEPMGKSPVKAAYNKHALWGISRWRDQRKSFYGYARGIESRHDMYSTKRILGKTQVDVIRKHKYGYLKEIKVRRADNDLYTFKEGDFSRLRINDIKDISTNVHQKHVIQKRVKDLQLGVESYQKKINVTKPETIKPRIRKRDRYTPYQDPKGFIYVDNKRRNELM
nr:ubiquitin carboxyl-terminal hydrolase 12 [Tanacetum cinerariifolium]